MVYHLDLITGTSLVSTEKWGGGGMSRSAATCNRGVDLYFFLFGYRYVKYNLALRSFLRSCIKKLAIFNLPKFKSTAQCPAVKA
jgi:hypothetical protein